MEKIHGTGISSGMVLGKIHLIKKTKNVFRQTDTACDPVKETERFRDGCRTLQNELEELYNRTKETLGESEAEIFTIHQMMLGDEAFTELVESAITDGRSAPDAVSETGNILAGNFASMENPYMQAREADIRSIAERLTEILLGNHNIGIDLQEPCILAVHDLSPAQTMELDLNMVLGFITEQGSVNSHTAILARTLGIPAIAASGDLPERIHGKEGILDGGSGILYITPDTEILRKYEQSRMEEAQKKVKWETMRGHTCIREDGCAIQIYANAGSMEDVLAAAENDAEGIGLFRSEFLFMQYDRCPTEEEQYAVYCEVLQKIPGREVVIRTLDAGADKKIPWLPSIPGETNPALGFRAIRICLRYPELLTTQLRAIYRASAHGRISAMIPMITLPSELDSVLNIAGIVRQSLQKESIRFDPDMPIGIMIETPSAALQAETMAKKASFFSIGTNDLTQYTMAADRENAAITYLTETVSESVKTLIHMTAETAQQAAIPVSICGEMAGDASMIPFFLQEGITKLSVSPKQVLRVRSEAQAYLDRSQTKQKTKGK